ncbi:MAG: hypothetical protein MUE93_07695 [Ignavibacteriaceae bacterium]|nr:hypothetical protein [Ignavibacteriaceae bacterium]MCU0415062.1 hypothetical protein [Ignavibacteriaceae bacterium]
MLFKKSLILFSLIILMQGCLVFHTVSYEVNLDDEKSGTVTLNVSDIRSDAMNTSELEEDKNQLFNFILESDEFVQQMSEEGKFILDRKLFISDGKLSGTLKYSFDDVSKVEGIVYQEPFYFITIPLEDSIISTNGEVIISEGHKRIMWDNTIRTLKFKMFSVDVNKGSLVELTKYLED